MGKDETTAGRDKAFEAATLLAVGTSARGRQKGGIREGGGGGKDSERTGERRGNADRQPSRLTPG